MKVRRIFLPSAGKNTWMVLGDNYHPIEPIQSFLRFMESIERSPNTIESYARHLKLWWEFLSSSHRNWQYPTLEDLAEFILWLREPNPIVVCVQQRESRRLESSINTILAAVYSFYNYQCRLGNARLDAYESKFIPTYAKQYKPFLTGIMAQKPIRTKLVKLKVPKTAPKSLTQGQVEKVIEACNLLRDKFLVCLLYRTGMRIGQALGLRHEDIERKGDGNHKVHIVPRSNNANGARAKKRDSYFVHINQELLHLYTEYLIEEYPLDTQFSDYVFVNVSGGKLGRPMTIANVEDLFERLGKAVGFRTTPHMLRHTHATELIRSGSSMIYVQNRLGHANIQTTINTYVHLSNEELAEEYKRFQQKQKQESE